MIRKVLDNKFLKFLLTGALNTVFGYLIFCLFTFIIGNAYAAVILSTVAGVLFNFRTYGSLVFKSNDNSRIFSFFAAYLFLIAAQILLLKWLNHLGIENPYVAVAVAIAPMAILSFVILKKFVFHSPLVPNPDQPLEKDNK